MNVALAAAAMLAARQLPERLPRAEAVQIAMAAERAQLSPDYRRRRLGADFQGVESDPHFYSVAIVPSWGEGIDYFTVDRRTGDVWADLGCKLIRSRELTALEVAFRRRFRIHAWRVRQIETYGSPATGCSRAG